MSSEDIFAQGYAIPCYGIIRGVRYWRCGDETYTLPDGAVLTTMLENVPFRVAKIIDIRRAHAAQKVIQQESL